MTKGQAMPTGAWTHRPPTPPQPGTVWAPPLGEVSEKTADTYRAARDDSTPTEEEQ